MTRIFALATMLTAGLVVAGPVAGQDDYGYGTSGNAGAGAPAAAGAKSETYRYRARMSTAQEVPRPSAPAAAKGLFTATVTESGTAVTLQWTLTFGGLSGKAAAAHIHRGKPGKAGPVLVALCGPCKTGQKGTSKLTRAANEALEQGRAYVNLHTAANQAGEIRGQVKATAKT